MLIVSTKEKLIYYIITHAYTQKHTKKLLVSSETITITSFAEILTSTHSFSSIPVTQLSPKAATKNSTNEPNLHEQKQTLAPHVVLASAPLHIQDTEIGLGALVWQPQPISPSLFFFDVHNCTLIIPIRDQYWLSPFLWIHELYRTTVTAFSGVFGDSVWFSIILKKMHYCLHWGTLVDFDRTIFSTRK